MISQTAEYALRAVVHLAQADRAEHASAQEISESVQVPVGYLQKILRQLARAGILLAQRGSGGGFSLAKVPSAISVLDILRAVDSAPARIERCPLGIKGHTSLCTLHRLLDDQMANSERVFGATSIADLVRSADATKPLCDPLEPAGRTVSVRVNVDSKGDKSAKS